MGYNGYGKKWTEEEDEVILTGWPSKKVSELCSILKRSVPSVEGRMKFLRKIGLIEFASKEDRSRKRKTHGQAQTKMYHTWSGMKERCRQSGTKNERWYKSKGITVCDEWLSGFEPFYEWAIKNGWEEHLTIDRIDSAKGYSPNNCRFIDYIGQANNRTNNKIITIHGENKTIAQWARDKRCEITVGALKYRVKSGNFNTESLLTKR